MSSADKTHISIIPVHYWRDIKQMLNINAKLTATFVIDRNQIHRIKSSGSRIQQKLRSRETNEPPK